MVQHASRSGSLRCPRLGVPMSHAYSNPKRASDPHALPDVEVFYVSASEASNRVATYAYGGESDGMTEPGFYWWTCFPGCLPDSDPFGPFDSEAAALADAHENCGDDDDEEEEEEEEACEGDYTLTPCGVLGGKTGLGQVGGKFLGEFDSDTAALAFIREHMAREKFYPNVWSVSDHGNWTLLTLDPGGVAK